MTESEMIRALAGSCARSSQQLNRLFECDAELLRIGERIWGLTMDDFSPGEDLFIDQDPHALGHNLAVATLSDLFAAGAEPHFFMQALSITRMVTPTFLAGLSEGIRTALESIGCSLCGGDLGISDPWRYCGFAMGPIVSPRPLTHRIPEQPQRLWVTGTLGDANLAAFLGRPPPLFEMRTVEAALFRPYASACIDTSGGLMQALWILHEMNPCLRIVLEKSNVPLASGIRASAQTARYPSETVLLGGAGEYELLFSAPADLPDIITNDWNKVGLTGIGRVSADTPSGLYIQHDNGAISAVTMPPPCPRSAETVLDHAREVISMARCLFGT